MSADFVDKLCKTFASYYVQGLATNNCLVLFRAAPTGPLKTRQLLITESKRHAGTDGLLSGKKKRLIRQIRRRAQLHGQMRRLMMREVPMARCTNSAKLKNICFFKELLKSLFMSKPFLHQNWSLGCPFWCILRYCAGLQTC